MAELSHRSELKPPCNGLAERKTRQPEVIAAAKSSVPFRSRLRVANRLETAQRGLAAQVRIAQGMLEHQELVDIPGQRLGCETSHTGTGSAMARNRSVATRKYADVESGSYVRGCRQ